MKENSLKCILILLHIYLLHNKNMLQIMMNAKKKDEFVIKSFLSLALFERYFHSKGIFMF